MVEAVREATPLFNDLEIKILQALIWESSRGKVAKEVGIELGIKGYLVGEALDKILDRLGERFGTRSLPLLIFWATKEEIIDTSQLPKSPLTLPLTDRQKNVLEYELTGSVFKESQESKEETRWEGASLVNCRESILGKFSVGNFNAVAARLPTMKDSLPDVYERIDKHLRAS